MTQWGKVEKKVLERWEENKDAGEESKFKGRKIPEAAEKEQKKERQEGWIV